MILIKTMKKTTQLIILSLVMALTFCSFNSQAQVNDNQDSTVMFESLNDSIDIANSINYFVDSLGYYMFSEGSDSLEIDSPINLSDDDLPASDIYLNWDSLSVHYPRFNFATKTDTTYLSLLDEGGSYIQPVPGIVTSNFGIRKRMFHYGIDLKLSTGDTVASAFDGVVRLTKRSRSYGYVVVVRHYNGLETLYAHLSKILVQPNEKVNSGTPIGLGGNTGWSRGSHLHWETRYLGAAINPNDIYDFTTQSIKKDTLAISKHTFDYMNRIHLYKKKFKNGRTHIVKQGETLAQIAKKHGTTVQKLKKLNKLKGNKLRPKQRIRV
jgi:hypothetical protein